MTRRAVALLLSVLMVATRTHVSEAQRFSALQGDPATPNLPYDGRFTFARLRYTVASGGYYYRGLPAWAHGYAHAEENLLAITHEVSVLDAHRDGSNVLAIDDPALFKYPVAYMTEAGYWVMSDKEGAALRKYLIKGGFLILDDTRDGFSPGNMGMGNIENNFRRVFPGLHFVDISIAHPIFHSFFDIESFSIVPQYYDRGAASFRALFVDNDPNKRLLVLLNFNTDVSNFWEFSATGFQPIAGSNEAYKLGVNYLIYALTH
jgi:Domain of unknown function (DUF4159)